MDFEFKKKKLEALYTEEKNAHKYPGVVDDFFEIMAIIDAAVDERDLYAQKGLRFEKLQGKRGKEGQRSLRLNDPPGSAVTPLGETPRPYCFTNGV